ncbi:hypothetical protein [Pelagibaculum spongiae]|uniref:Uncharacterized protein n=1 Tax=Pelagibaculum spongiae TaxID=2080658 RepID=A0A2V1H7F1_9GAMM|nr:hypothetical protein [Pelagibaculum spongiae]PVZ72392.1 hypothetical protein DC094_05140 [Pelagibaculum spongiae]
MDAAVTISRDGMYADTTTAKDLTNFNIFDFVYAENTTLHCDFLKMDADKNQPSRCIKQPVAQDIIRQKRLFIFRYRLTLLLLLSFCFFTLFWISQPTMLSEPSTTQSTSQQDLIYGFVMLLLGLSLLKMTSRKRLGKVQNQIKKKTDSY